MRTRRVFARSEYFLSVFFSEIKAVATILVSGGFFCSFFFLLRLMTNNDVWFYYWCKTIKGGLVMTSGSGEIMLILCFLVLPSFGQIECEVVGFHVASVENAVSALSGSFLAPAQNVLNLDIIVATPVFLFGEGSKRWSERRPPAEKRRRT